jgi:hypothetical protein
MDDGDRSLRIAGVTRPGSKKTTRYGLSLKEKKFMKNGIIAILCAILLSFGVAMTASAGSVVDTDGDAVPDLFDNCRDASNGNVPFNGPFGTGSGSCNTPEQLDTDGDGIGNPCDGDLDDSGLVDGSDVSELFGLLFGVDNEGDLDCTGLTDGSDVSKMFTLLFKNPGPGALPAP